MKKVLMILFVFIAFKYSNYTLNADVEYLDCTYLRTYRGDTNSENNFIFTIRYTPKKILGKYSYKEEILDGTSQWKGTFKSNNNTYTVEIDSNETSLSTTYGDYQASLVEEVNGTLKMKQCPDLFYEDNSKTKVTIHHVATASQGSQPYMRLQRATDDGKVSTGDNNNKNKKTSCTVQVALSSATGSSMEDFQTKNLANQMIALTFDTYEDGSVYVTCQDCNGNNGGYLKKSNTSDVALHFTKNFASVFSQMSVDIYNNDVDSLIKKFPYGLSEENCPENLVINKYDEDNKIAVSTDKRKDATSYTEASKSNTVDGNVDFFPQTIISTDPAYCKDLLDEKLISFIQSAWTLVKVASIVICVLFGVIDFVSSASASKDKLMESVNKSIRRLIIVIIILLLPTIIDIMGDILGQKDILCGIR